MGRGVACSWAAGEGGRWYLGVQVDLLPPPLGPGTLSELVPASDLRLLLEWTGGEWTVVSEVL